MSIRLIYEQALSGALGGWIGHDVAVRLAGGGSSAASGGLIGGSIGFLVLVPAARRLAGGTAARLLVVGAFAGGLAGAVGFGFPFGWMTVPPSLGVLVGGLAVGLTLGVVRWPGLVGVRAGLLGGLAGGLAMAGVSFVGVGPASVSTACLGSVIGLVLALPSAIGDNSESIRFRDTGATG